VSAQKLSTGIQPATYVLSAAQATSDAVQLQMSSSAKPSTAPVFARLLGPGGGIRLAGILPSDIQQQWTNTKPPAPVTAVDSSTCTKDKPTPSSS